MAPRANLKSIHQPDVTLKLCSRCGNIGPTRPKRKICILCTNTYVREWNAKQDPQVVAKRNFAYRKEHRPEILAQKRSYYELNWLRMVLHQAQIRAEKKAIPFDITENDIVMPECCPVLGTRLVLAKGAVKDDSPSLDRVDPYMGYVRGNVEVMSHRANRIKSDGSPEEHERVAAWQRSRKNGN